MHDDDSLSCMMMMMMMAKNVGGSRDKELMTYNTIEFLQIYGTVQCAHSKVMLYSKMRLMH
jgi:hypothetical protein